MKALYSFTVTTAIIFGCASQVMAQAESAIDAGFTRFETYQAKAGGMSGITDHNLYSFSPNTMSGHVNFVELDGRVFEVARVSLKRTSEISETFFEASIILYDVKASEQAATAPDQDEPGVPGVGFRKKLKGTLLKPIYLTLDTRLDQAQTMTDSPCKDFGCGSNDIVGKTWYRVATAQEQAFGFKSWYFRRSLKIKSVDYNWATGAWKNLVIADMEAHELTPKNIPHGGITVSN